MGSRIRRHLRSQFVGYIALVLAMTGTAYAIGANSVGDRELAKNSVGSSEVERDSLKANDLAANSVGAEELADAQSCAYLGQIIRVGFGYAPPGTLEARGQELPISQFVALFALYGTTYGGDGRTTFGLPNLTSADGTTIYLVCTSGDFPPRPGGNRSASTPECGYVGQILRVGFDYAPPGTFAANGASLPIAGNQALFSLFQNTYGGSGNNFNLPNLTSSDGTTKYLVCSNGVYPARS